jgi:hypothetical protein
MTCRPRSTAAAHFGDGSERAADGILCGSGWSGVAVSVMYKKSPRIAVTSSPTAATISAIQVSVRFQLFDTVGRIASESREVLTEM